MPISSTERNLRFSKLPLAEYNDIYNHYIVRLLESLQNEPNFVAIYESGSSYIKPKAEIKKDAEKLANHKDVSVAKLGKSIIKFLAKGASAFDELCLCITTVLLIGGIALSISISVIISVLLFAVLILPFAMLTAGLALIDAKIIKTAGIGEDKNVSLYRKLSKNIQEQKGGVKDIKDLDKIVSTLESLDTIKDNPELLKTQESVDLLRIVNVVENRMLPVEEGLDYNSHQLNLAAIESRMSVYENLGPEHLCYSVPEYSNIMESTNLDDTDVFTNLKRIVSKPLLSGKGLLNGMVAITTESCDRTALFEFFNRYKNTVSYEMQHENYRDLPIITETGLCLEYIRECCRDLPEVMESCDTLLDTLIEIVVEAKKEITEDVGFNPNPFSIGSLTPLPVADRAVGNVLCDIIEAETDEEISEALIKFGRLTRVVNESYYVDGDMLIVTEGIVDKAKKAKIKVKGKLSPMERFVTAQLDKVKKADADERRRIIMQGGSASKLFYKIWRWVKRGIVLLIGAKLGTYSSVAGLITGITFVGFIVTDRYMDKKERAKILRELEDEIAIVNEKIDDSRGDDNKQKKYELMRIRNELQRQRDKIRYNLAN